MGGGSRARRSLVGSTLVAIVASIVQSSGRSTLSDNHTKHTRVSTGGLRRVEERASFWAPHRRTARSSRALVGLLVPDRIHSRPTARMPHTQRNPLLLSGGFLPGKARAASGIPTGPHNTPATERQGRGVPRVPQWPTGAGARARRRANAPADQREEHGLQNSSACLCHRCLCLCYFVSLPFCLRLPLLELSK